MKTMVARGFAVAALLSAAVPGVRADEAAVAAPHGSKLVLETRAQGIQAYVCEAKDQGYEWVFKGPEAALFDKDGRQVGNHFGGPTWKGADGSTIVGEVAGKSDAPAAGAIPWLLLRAKGHDGAGTMASVAFVRRIDTQGGAAPKGGCDAHHAAEQARMQYSAVYQFFTAGQ